MKDKIEGFTAATNIVFDVLRRVQNSLDIALEIELNAMNAQSLKANTEKLRYAQGAMQLVAEFIDDEVSAKIDEWKAADEEWE